MVGAKRLECALLNAWSSSRLHVEWMVNIIFDHFCRLRYELSPAAWEIELPRHTPSRREVTDDLMALSRLVQCLRMDASRDQNKETHPHQNQQTTDRHLHSVPADMPFLFTNRPRIAGRATKTRFPGLPPFFSTSRSQNPSRNIPYDLWNAIRTNDCHTLARWCECLDKADPMHLKMEPPHEALQCLGYRGCGGWPSLTSGSNLWFLFTGTEASFSRLVWTIRSLEAPAESLEVACFFDLCMRPVIAIWGGIAHPCANKNGRHSGDMAAIAKSIRQSFHAQVHEPDPFR